MLLLLVGQPIGAHQPHRLLGQHPHTVDFATRQKHSGERQIVVGRGEMRLYALANGPVTEKKYASPLRWVIRSSTVIGRRAGCVLSSGPPGAASTRMSDSSGNHFATGSVNASLPSSTKAMAAATVT